MDFLDPREKKLRSIRLMIGYALMTVMIFTATLILVFQAYGFGVDGKTGEVIQRGLVYVDSAPDGASLYIDGVEHKDLTNTRVVLKEGTYNFTIKKDGYRDWSRKVEVTGGSIERLTYPMIIQTNLAEEEILNFGQVTNNIRTQSPDRRWILVSNPANFAAFTQLDLKDANKRSDLPLSSVVNFPSDIFTSSEQPSTYEVVDWSNDNEHFLVKHNIGQTYEYVVLNRDRPETSFNINRLLNRDLANLTLRDKKFNEWFFQDRNTGDLLFANAKSEVSEVAKAVISYKSHGNNMLVYSQKAGNDFVNIFIKQDKDTKLLRSVKVGQTKVNVASFDGRWYFAVASDGDKRTYIYRDPWNVLSKNNTDRPAPQAILRSENPISLLDFSTNSRFILARDAQHFAVYDAELDKMYNTTFKDTIDPQTEVEWMDGHRLLVRASNQKYMIEFDGSNEQKLVPAIAGESTFFNRDYTVAYSFQDSKVTKGTQALVLTDLRYEQDK